MVKVRGGFSETIEDFLRRVGLIKEKIEISERIIEVPLVFYLMHRNVKRILDIGCVENILSIQLASLGYKVTDIDMRNYRFRHDKSLL